MTNKSTSIEFSDIQGLAIRGFGKLTHACYTFVSISSVMDFKKWLKQTLITGEITPATVRDPKEGLCLTIAFTAKGLQKLLGDAWVANSFPSEFVEGMVQEHRSRLLGDIDANAPVQWRWGNGDNIDCVLVVLAKTEQEINDKLDKTITAATGMTEVYRQTAFLPEDNTEPFGFADGISQPIISGTDREKEIRQENTREHRLHTVATGEFVLGYKDGSDELLPRSPAISPAIDTAGRLIPHHEQAELRDFGRNGTFMVIRQLAQDVKGFDDYVKKNAVDGIDIAAKMVGRTKTGETVTSDPDTDPKSKNDFDYLNDLSGKGCPIGSHVRRTNPRSTVHASSHEDSLKVTNRHRIIRRGRVYKNPDGETGLMFLCLNASINRQFEFVQSTWSNDPFFQGLASEVDPIIGTQRDAVQDFTIQREPYRCKLKSLPQWITVKGGGYYFLPGLNALAVLAES